jgi:hypothetical protein
MVTLVVKPAPSPTAGVNNVELHESLAFLFSSGIGFVLRENHRN